MSIEDAKLPYVMLPVARKDRVCVAAMKVVHLFLFPQTGVKDRSGHRVLMGSALSRCIATAIDILLLERGPKARVVHYRNYSPSALLIDVLIISSASMPRYRIFEVALDYLRAV
jgi:hypothetical protein